MRKFQKYRTPKMHLNLESSFVRAKNVKSLLHQKTFLSVAFSVPKSGSRYKTLEPILIFSCSLRIVRKQRVRTRNLT